MEIIFNFDYELSSIIADLSDNQVAIAFYTAFH